MSGKLQQFGTHQSKYERPNLNWKCGHTHDGNECPNGPDAKGRCQATFECLPYKNGERWYCSRPPQRGGACEDGPMPDGTCCRPVEPCQPLRSVRFQRKRVVYAVFALTLGITLMVLFGDRQLQWITPGPVSSVHASFSQDCAKCHTAVMNGAVNWLAMDTETEAETDQPSTDSHKCLECHNLGEQGLQPHNLSKEQRGTLTQSSHLVMSSTPSVALKLAAAYFPNPVMDGMDIDCASCHREHHGFQADIKSISSHRCQICHSVQFEDVSKDHPSFGDYPKIQSSRILFNHSTHMQKHFKNAPGGETVFECMLCHQASPSGKHILTGPFEQTCSECHNDDLMDSGSLAALNVPFLDKPTLDESEKPIGYWPDVDPGLVFEPFAPVLLLLLAGDDSIENWQETVEMLLTVEDLSYLEPEDEEIQIAAQQLAWAVKSLYHDLSSDGHAAIQSRLENVLNHSLLPSEIAALAGAISPDTVQNAVANWFPNIQEELEAYGAGEDLPEAPDYLDWLDFNMDWSSAGGWGMDGEMYTIFYKPTGHKDAFMKTWINISIELINQNNSEIAKRSLTLFTNEDAPGKCLKCHHLSQKDDGRLFVQWNALQFSSQNKMFTTFGHAPHIKTGQDLTCTSCHVINHESAEAFETASKAHNNTSLISNFSPVSNQTCFECHNSRNAGDSCLLCHNYHIHTSSESGNMMSFLSP